MELNKAVTVVADIIESLEDRAIDVLLKKHGLTLREFSGKFGRDASGYIDFAALSSRFPAPGPKLKKFLLGNLENEPRDPKVLRIFHDALVGLNHKISGSVKYITNLVKVLKTNPAYGETSRAKKERDRVINDILKPALEWVEVFDALYNKAVSMDLLFEWEDDTDLDVEHQKIIDKLLDAGNPENPITHYNKKHIPNLKDSITKLESVVANGIAISSLKLRMQELLGAL